MNREPVLVIALIKALIVAAVAFGLKLTLEQTAALYAVVEAAATLWQRSRVTPVDDPRGL
jgi:hypothetical protein